MILSFCFKTVFLWIEKPERSHFMIEIWIFNRNNSFLGFVEDDVEFRLTKVISNKKISVYSCYEQRKQFSVYAIINNKFNMQTYVLFTGTSITCKTRQDMNVYNILLKEKSERPFSITQVHFRKQRLVSWIENQYFSIVNVDDSNLEDASEVDTIKFNFSNILWTTQW